MKVSGRRKQKRLAAAERREVVLDAALALVTRSGVFRVTMADVADEAGVTKPVVYDYFTNADYLLAALVKREGARVLDVLRDVLPDPASLPVGGEARAGVLVAKLGAFFRAVERDPDLWRLTLMPPEGTAAPIRARVEKEREAVRQRILELLIASLPGARRALDLDLVSHAVHALIQRFARVIILEPEEYSAARVMKFVRRLAAARDARRPAKAQPHEAWHKPGRRAAHFEGVVRSSRRPRAPLAPKR
jgi:AcrR family transcriptional regulator